MPAQIWTQLLTPQQQASGAAFGTFTTAKSVINPQSLIDLPRNFFAVGTKLRHRISMGIRSLVTTPGTVTFEIHLGTIAIWSSGAIQLNATAHTIRPAVLEVTNVCQVVGTGTTAKCLGIGKLTGVMFTATIAATDSWGRVSAADAKVSDVTLVVPIASPAQGTGFDSTISTLLDFYVGFSVSDAANTVQVFDYEVEGVNYIS